MKNRVWFITGASSGFGLALIKKLLADVEATYCVAGSSRDAERLMEQVRECDKKRFLPLKIDLASEQSIQAGIDATLRHFGTIDVAVNNAGYELHGYIEELSIEEVKNNFAINFFAPFLVMQKILPIFKQQRHGYIINMSSMGGTCYSWAGSASYCASKAALDSLSKAFSDEVKKFGVFATSVKPGQFRTNFFESAQDASQEIGDYNSERHEHQEMKQRVSKHQPGDPGKLADVLIQLSKMDKPPVQIFAGRDAYDVALQNARSIEKNLDQWADVTKNLSF